MSTRLLRHTFAAIALVASVVAAGHTAAAAGDAAAAPGREGPARVTGADRPDAIPNRYIVVLKEGTSRMGAESARGTAVRRGAQVHRDYSHALKGFAATLPPSALEALRANPDVEYIEADAVVTAQDTSTGATWGLDRVDQRSLPLDGAYTDDFKGRGVKAYVLDTGIRTTHSEFGGRATFGYSVNSFLMPAEYSAANVEASSTDCNGHGTHVAGTIGGSTYGIARQVSLVSVRVLDCSGSGTLSGVIEGVEWVTADHQAGQPAVANMSLGGGASDSLDAAVAASIRDGVTYAVAAGNMSLDACRLSPARAPAALTVGAATATDARAHFSNYGSCVDLFAPGASITSALNQSDTATGTKSGTSMAAPHVAGAAALYLEGNPTATPGIVASAVVNGATSGVVSNAGSGSPNLLLYSRLTRPPVAGQNFTPVSPARVWDSRVGPGPIGPLGAGEIRDISITGAGFMPRGTSTIVLNLTAVAPSVGTFITVWPAGEVKPQTSNLNIPAGDTRSNFVTVKLGTGGKVSVYNYAGTVNLIADVSGWYASSGTHKYTALSPTRVWDTRIGPGPTGRIGAGGTPEVPLTGIGGVPATGVSAVVINVTAATPTAGTFITAWPTGEARPNTSNINLPAGDVRANVITVKVGAGGKVSFYNDAGTIDLIADIAGYYSDTGTSLTITSPSRLWDSRVGPGPEGPLGPAQTSEVTVAGANGLPTTGVRSVLINLTAINATAATHISVWPTGEPRPATSNINIPAGDTRANFVVVKVGATGQVSFYNDAGTVDLAADVTGWHSAE